VLYSLGFCNLIGVVSALLCVMQHNVLIEISYDIKMLHVNNKIFTLINN